MKKEYLRRTYQTTATDEMMKMAENDHPVKEKSGMEPLWKIIKQIFIYAAR